MSPDRPVPLVDLGAQYAALRGEIDAAIARVIGHGAFILGREVQAFEEAFAGACGARAAVGVASGTAAIRLALEALGVGPDDEVLTTPFTFVGTVEPILHRGAQVRFVDVDPATANLDAARLEAATTPRTRAVLPVHLYGCPADLAPMLALCRRRGLVLIEDAAQAHLARYRGTIAGTLGDAGCFSFYPGKNLGAYGDGGMVITQDDAVAGRLRMLRDHGRRDKYVHEAVGYGDRLDALQAAVLGAKLPHLAAWTRRRQAVAAAYRERLAGLPLALPATPPDVEAAFHLFVIRCAERDRVRAHLQAAGIAAGVHYPVPLHRQPALAFLGHKAGDFPEAERAAREVLSLPMYPELTEAQIDRVTAAVRGFFGR